MPNLAFDPNYSFMVMCNRPAGERRTHGPFLQLHEASQLSTVTSQQLVPLASTATLKHQNQAFLDHTPPLPTPPTHARTQ